jgi:RNA polymerase sigma-70 factor (ECF subfamily)
VRYKVFNLIDRKKVRSDYLSLLDSFIKRNEYSGEYRLRAKQMEEFIEKEIAALPQKMREVFELSRKANLNYREIAEKLNISDNTVKKQMSNALKILRSRLGIIFDLFFLLVPNVYTYFLFFFSFRITQTYRASLLTIINTHKTL